MTCSALNRGSRLMRGSGEATLHDDEITRRGMSDTAPESRRMGHIDYLLDLPQVIDDRDLLIIDDRAVRLARETTRDPARTLIFRALSIFLLIVTVGSIFAAGFATMGARTAIKQGAATALAVSMTMIIISLMMGTSTFVIRRRLWRWADSRMQ